MHEKDLGIAEYLDLYGDILEERQHQIIDMYYNEDYSLSEISEITGITRQGVSESVRKSVKRLREMDEKLHLKSRIASFEKQRDALADKAADILGNSKDAAELIECIRKLSV